MGDSWWVLVPEVKGPKSKTLQYALFWEAGMWAWDKELLHWRSGEGLLAGFGLSGLLAPSQLTGGCSWVAGTLAVGRGHTCAGAHSCAALGQTSSFCVDVLPLLCRSNHTTYRGMASPYIPQGISTMVALPIPLGILIVAGQSSGSHETGWDTSHVQIRGGPEEVTTSGDGLQYAAATVNIPLGQTCQVRDL